MTPDQQRIAIATACGWKCAGHPDQLAATVGYHFACQFVLTPEGKLVTHNSVPDYLGDLNAMHEAEKVLMDEQCVFIRLHLRERLENHPASRYVWNATARQRAEAFLRTLGLWQSTPTQPQ
jgi:hypothetical protein